MCPVSPPPSVAVGGLSSFSGHSEGSGLWRTLCVDTSQSRPEAGLTHALVETMSEAFLTYCFYTRIRGTATHAYDWFNNGLLCGYYS